MEQPATTQLPRPYVTFELGKSKFEVRKSLAVAYWWRVGETRFLALANRTCASHQRRSILVTPI